MYLIKVTKRYRNSCKSKYLIIADLDNMEYAAWEWADQDPAGQSDGYTIEYSHVEDDGEMLDACLLELKEIDRKETLIADRKLRLQNQINSILASSGQFGVGFIAGFNAGLKRNKRVDK